jgi:hypothetical protein
MKSAFVITTCLLLAGCLGSAIPTSTNPPDGADGSVVADAGGSVPASDAGSPPLDATVPIADLALVSPTPGDLASLDMTLACDKPQSTATLSSPNGHHNAGTECQGCHAPGNGAPTFYLGGTLYSSVSGSTAVSGATINVVDAAGQSLKIVSAQNGNFWTTKALTFPLHVDASLCPATTPMIATVAGNGACNNCHNSTLRVHVP